MNMIELNNVTKRFGDKVVLKGLSMRIGRGERFSITGRSGAGKTTLLRLISGLEKPDSGSIAVNTDKISFAFQEDRLLPWYSALRNVEIVSNSKAARELLGELGLENDIHKLPAELSGGMRSRVSLARALAYDSEILLLDEAFKGLDEQSKGIALSVVLKYLGDRTLVCVTHDKKVEKALTSVRYEISANSDMSD